MTDIPEPFSEIDQTRYQIKRYLVKCEYCKYEIYTSLLGVKCGKCKQPLITVIGSLMPNNELA